MGHSPCSIVYIHSLPEPIYKPSFLSRVVHEYRLIDVMCKIKTVPLFVLVKCYDDLDFSTT